MVGNIQFLKKNNAIINMNLKLLLRDKSSNKSFDWPTGRHEAAGRLTAYTQ